MKVLISFGILLCLAVFTFAQETPEELTVEQGVEEITLFKDDGKGKPGDEASEFMNTDSPIHCRVQLNSQKATAVKMLMVAVEAKGFKAGSKVITVAYKTNGKQNVVNFQASDGDGWQPGKYKMDILLDDKRSKSIEFTISQKETPAEAKPKPAVKARSLAPKKKKKG